LQVEDSLIERTIERELVPMAKALNLSLTAWSPLARGVLTGKYHGHRSSEQGRLNSDTMKDFMPDEQRTGRIVAAVKAGSDQTGRGMAQVALGFPYDIYAKEFVRATVYGGMRDRIVA
jgi:aryl-alcohol dehydrogenase-like predicted oxidoreductase